MLKVNNKMANDYFNLKKNGVQLIIYDFDGVFTDNRVLVFADGKEAVFCNRCDGLAIKKIKQLGIPQLILSTESNPVVEARAKKLGLPVINNIEDKKLALLDYCKKEKCELQKVIYIGNDINDLGAMQSVGYPIATQDAHKTIKRIAKSILKTKGGDGVIRELYDRLK